MDGRETGSGRAIEAGIEDRRAKREMMENFIFFFSSIDWNF
jgi:hypothetical protein